MRLTLRGLAGLGLLAAVALAIAPPIRQDPDYHRFADSRSSLGIPHFANVASNLLFLPPGLAGLAFVLRRPALPSRLSWSVFFAGVSLVAGGSAGYHAGPSDTSLIWDRLPMTLAFTGLLAALSGDYLDPRAGRRLLLPLLLAGLGSIGVWVWTGDLRAYVWVAFFPILALPLFCFLCPEAKPDRPWLLGAGLLYFCAKVFEAMDARIWNLSGGICAGHAIKHALSAAACGAFLGMLRVRGTQAVRTQGSASTASKGSSF